VLQTALASLAAAVISSVATLALTGKLARPDRAWLRRLWIAFLGLWPFLLVASGFWIAYGHANNWDFPSQEFYPISAEVIVLLLLGLIIERHVIAELHWLHRIEYGFILMAGEGAALLRTSGSPPESDTLDVLLSTFTVTALLSASVFVIAAVGRRGEARP
jgi:hypothetical protein